MFVTAVLSPDAEAFIAWCRSNRFTAAGDGAEGESGRWLALRILCATDLDGISIDRIDYALDFWRRGERCSMLTLDELARSRLRRRELRTGVLNRGARRTAG